MKVNHSARLRVPTVWHQLSAAGRAVVSLNLPVTYPPLDVRGIIVSGMDAPHLEAALSGAPAFAARLRAEVPGYHLRSLWKRPPRDLAELSENAEADRRPLPRRGRGGLAGRRVAARLVGIDGPVPEPRPLPAPGLATPERRRDRHRRPRRERRRRPGDEGPGRRDRPPLRAGRPPGSGDHGRQRPRVRPLPGPHPRQPHPRRCGRRPPAGTARQTCSDAPARPRESLRLWGAKTGRSRGPVGLVRHVRRRPVPLRLEANAGLRAPPGHRRDGLPELDRSPRECPPDHAPPGRRRPPLRRRRPVGRPPPRDRPSPLPEARPHRRGIWHRPRPRGLPRPDRAARRAILGADEARPRLLLGRGRPESSPAPTAPRGSSPCAPPASPPAAPSGPTSRT